MAAPYYGNYGSGQDYNDSGTGLYHDGSGIGPQGTGQTIDGKEYGYGYGIGLGGLETQYAPGDANPTSFASAYGSGDGQHQPPMYSQGHYQQPSVQQYPFQSFYPSASPGYGSQPGWQPGLQNSGDDRSKGSGDSVQGGPAVETGQEWSERRGVEISDQEDLPPINVQQIPRPSGSSKKTNKSRSSGNRQDSHQNRTRPEDETVRYGPGYGGSRTETFSQEERTNV
ncbi:hypothetical protein V8E51_007556 [Hyaloscypha variabilis]